MYINQNAGIEKHKLPGLEHQTLAGRRDGLKNVEVWRQTIEAGAETPVHRHDCEEVVVVLRGRGVCRIEGQDRAFAEDETLVIPPNVVHQICNTGEHDLCIVATLAMAPVKVETAEGDPMTLPWA
jgi:quercetin dioxygenase-like cupin family protein